MAGISRRQTTKLLGAGLATAGLGISAPAVWAQSNMTQLRVGVVPVLDAGAFFIAQANGYFAKERLEVTVTPTPGGGPSMAALVAGQLQVSMSTVTTMIQSQEQGLDLKIVSGISGSRPFPNDYSTVMVRKDTGIKTGKDVVGICCRICRGSACGCGSTIPAATRRRPISSRSTSRSRKTLC
jgi:NitT/TauT family transport system substrate-binding protein